MPVNLTLGGHLVCPVKIVNAYPIVIAGSASNRVPDSDGHFLAQQGSTIAVKGHSMIIAGASKIARSMIAAGSHGTANYTGGAAPGAALRRFMAIYDGPGSRRIMWEARTAVAVDTANVVDDFSVHDMFTIGANRIAGALDNFMDGSVAEYSVYSAVPSDADIDAWFAGTKRGEDIANCAACFPLVYSADGIYTSTNGLFTLTAIGAEGSVTASALPHPIARGFINVDLVLSYNVLTTAIYADLVLSYNVRAQVSKDLVLAYNVLQASGSITSDTLDFTPGTPYTTETVHYSWFPGGRTGAVSGIAPIEGSKALVAGKLLLSGLPLGDGMLDACVRGATPAQDAVFKQHLTAA